MSKRSHTRGLLGSPRSASLWLAGVFVVGMVIFGYTVIFRSHAATSPLPFDMPSTASLRSSNKLVFAHYFATYPISIDNALPKALGGSGDYYDNGYISPTGEGGAHSAYGGLLRDRPIPRQVLSVSGTMSTTCSSETAVPNYVIQDMKTEVQQAIAAGIDGFTLDLMSSPPGGNDPRPCIVPYAMLAAAQAVDPGFKIVLMPDMTAGPGSLTQDQLAAYVKDLGSKPSAYHLADGRLVVAPFYSEKQNAAWWKQWLDLMKNTYGVNVAFVPCFNDFQNAVIGASSQSPNFNDISYGYSFWGVRNPNDNTVPYSGGLNVNQYFANWAHSNGKIWMDPVSLQDERPDQYVYNEAGNTENLRATWGNATGPQATTGADWVQIPTWNDYSEEANIAPSVNLGYNALDLNSYYLIKFKTGNYPTIQRDQIYLSHRIMPYAASPSYPETHLMSHIGGQAARDTVEVIAFTTGPATVTINVGGHICTASIAAAGGAQAAPLCPLYPGTVSASLTRNAQTIASVTSPFTVTNTPYVQDENYRIVSSGREGTSVTPSATPTPSPSPSPTNLPDAPTALTSVPGDQHIVVNWAAPASDGGSPITGYRVTRETGDSVVPGSWTGTVSATTYSEDFTYLQNGTSYQFSINAITANGEGPKTYITATPVAIAAVVGDVNGDGKVNIFDLSTLLSKWGTNDAASDLNHDGTVNIFDLSTLLSHWTG